MVSNVLHMRHGLRDWIVQRLSALILFAYTLFWVGYFILHPTPTFVEWHALFSHLSMRLFSILALISIAMHVWVGLWIIITDYLKPIVIRVSVEAIVLVSVFIYVIWGIQILWGIR